MCARVAQLILAAFFLYVVVTVAAFVYLEWWQALLASFGTFLLIIFAGKLLIQTAIGKIGDFAKEMFRTKSQVLKGATVEVHSINPIDPPADAVRMLREQVSEDDDVDVDDQDPEAAEAVRVGKQRIERMLNNSNWYDIELTIFPDPAAATGEMTHWDVDDLRLIPADAKVRNPLDEEDDGFDNDEPAYDGEESTLYDLKVIIDGRPQELDGSKFQGPHRLRFYARSEKGVSEMKFLYYFEEFGRIRLPSPLSR